MHCMAAFCVWLNVKTTPIVLRVRLLHSLLLSSDAVAAESLPVRSSHSARLAASCTPCITGDIARQRGHI